MTWKELGDEPSPPQRLPTGGYGSLGRPILLTTNHFEVKVGKTSIRLYHYDVTIKDFRGCELLPKKKKMAIFEDMKDAFPKVFLDAFLSYDSMKNAYSTKNIPQLKKATSYEVALRSETGKNKSKYTVSMVKVNEASLKELFDCMKYVPGKKKDIPSTVTQMIEVMFRHYRAKKYEQVSGRNFFSLTGEFAAPNFIGGGKEGVTGFFGSLRPAAWKDGSILLNLDMAHTAFYKEQMVIEFIKETERLDDRDFTRPLDVPVRRKLDKSLKGLRIRVTHAMRTYKFLKVTESANKIKFDYTTDKGTKKVTVEEYMRLAYKINLQYPYLNCFHVGNPEKNVYIPIELCKIDKGQKVMKKLTDNEVSTFIRSTAVPPAERLRQIRAVAAKNNFKEDPMLKALTFSISDMPLQTKGRVLPAPSLTMVNKNFQPYQGVWDIRDKTFHRPAVLKHWAVLNYDGYRTRRDTLDKFLGMLVQMGRQKGMTIEKPFDIHDHKGRGDPCPLEDFKYYKQQNPETQLIMCVLPARKYYGAIKTAGDIEVNIISQCVVGTNVFKCQPQTVGNILLKINAKMGGVNNIVTGISGCNTGLLNFKEPFLIMGADVNHPPAGGDKGIPSLAAVVGSFDLHATKYALELRSQEERKEIIVDLESITKNLLVNFHRQTKGHKPHRILMYRDGVSESQFKEVLQKEMTAMRAACSSLDKSGNYRPGITFICVQKRHHTRLFCDERDGVGKSKNVPPGTIVDKDITHPTERDFFLCSHQGIQGTSKPTHYHVLWDDNDLPVDELQLLTYKLCHVYSRCSRAVSIPTPVYYAHLAAFRAKVYVTEILEGGSDSGSTFSSGSGRVGTVQEGEIRRTTRLTIDGPLASKLHYI